MTPFPISRPSEAPNEPMVQVLEAIAGELAQMAQAGDRLQLLISAALVSDGRQNAEHLREFQSIDLLVQRLHGVAIFTGCLAAVTPGDWGIDAASAAVAVPLSDLARRLGGDKTAASCQRRKDDPSGDLEMFG